MQESNCGLQKVGRSIGGERREMPGLWLTRQQARRLWRLDETSYDAILAAPQP